MDRRRDAGERVSGPSSIEWTDATWNPTRGCAKISPGCKHCYAETFAERFRGVAGHPYERGFDPRTAPDQLGAPLAWRKPRRVFVNSMSDLFLEEFPNEYIAAVFGVMAACPQHTFQILTKRPDRMHAWFEWVARRGDDGLRMFPDDPADWRIRQLCHVEARRRRVDLNADKRQNHGGPWPLPNVWLGTSVEDQQRAEERIPWLVEVPAVVRFLSCEPLLEAVDLTSVRPYYLRRDPHPNDPVILFDCLRGHMKGPDELLPECRVQWVIVGGESGVRARPAAVEWVRAIVGQCRAAGVPAFVKQLGARALVQHPMEPGALLPVRLNDRKGGDPAEWPADLNVREFPSGVEVVRG